MTQNSKYKNDFELSHQEIDRTAESVSEILSDFHVERKTCLRARLLIEELLLGIMTSRDIPVTCRFSFIKKFGNGTIRISYDGKPFDPLLQENSDEFTALLLENLGIPCRWNYKTALILCL
jgi:hypothetical protein